MLLAAQILAAVGTGCLYQCGIAHINANANPRYASSYISIVSCIAPLGTSVAWVMMGKFLSAGIWWLPFFINSACLFCLVPLFMQLDATPSKLTSGMQVSN